MVGKGGREQAIIHALKQAPSVDQVFCFPGREGFFVPKLSLKRSSLSSQDSRTNPTDLQKTTNTLQQLIPIIQEKNIQCVIIGPEQELVEGWSDELRSQGIAVFGPSQKASQLEGSKIFAKKFMEKSGVPTSSYYIVESVSETLEKSKNFQSPYVLKADGLAGGKGVFICKNQEELKTNAEKLFEKKIFGEAGRQALLEEFQKGYELSVFILTNGKEYCTLPLAQDYKKLKNENLGPNTGGMGATAPMNVSQDLMNEIHKNILQPTIQQIQQEKLFYCGVLYVGLMITDTGPKVLEYNVRFGDPECQVLLPLLDGDMGSLFYETAQGKLPSLKFKNLFSCCVALAEKGYPENPQKGAVILDKKNILSQKSFSSDSYFLHAGTKKSQEDWLVDGGRVLNAIGLGSTKEQAREKAYHLIEQIPQHNLHFRTDIGKLK